MTTTRPPDPYAAFLRALRRTPRTWRVLWDGRIRQGRDCPLTAACKWRGITMKWLMEWARVIAAADRTRGHDPRLRARLLKACGVTERRG